MGGGGRHGRTVSPPPFPRPAVFPIRTVADAWRRSRGRPHHVFVRRRLLSRLAKDRERQTPAAFR